jgi:KAP family P-loop domain
MSSGSGADVSSTQEDARDPGEGSDATAKGTAPVHFRLLGDRPHNRANDPLGFDKLAGDLCSLILASADNAPFTLGIEASWGMGKSSLMGRLRQHLSEASEHEVHTVWFNAWTAEQKQDVLEGLIRSVLESLDSSVLRRFLRKRYTSLALRVAMTIAGRLVGSARLADQIWEQFAADPTLRNEIRDELDRAIGEWLAKPRLRPESAPLFVIFIDDLDRCSPRSVFQIFEAIKLYLDLPYFVFVVGFDPNGISDAILEEKKYSASVSARQYIEKIIQIIYPIPRPDRDQLDNLMGHYLKATGAIGVFAPRERTLVFQSADRNPRRIKRFINAFIMESHLEAGPGSLPASMLARVLLVHLSFPEFTAIVAKSFRENPLRDFLDYKRSRAMLNGTEPIDSDFLVRVIKSYGVSLPETEDWGGYLERLEPNLPDVFRELVLNPAFIDLVEDLATEEYEDHVLQKLRRTRVPVVAPAESGPGPDSIPNLTGLRILWIDEKPEATEPERKQLVTRGATVKTVPAPYTSLRAPPEPDLLVSHVASPHDRDSFYDIATLHSEGALAKPVIFYTGYLTEARRERAKSLQAEITDAPEELMLMIKSVYDRRQPGLADDRLQSAAKLQ